MGYCHQFEIFTLKSIPVEKQGFKAGYCRLDIIDEVESEIAGFPLSRVSNILEEKQAMLMQAIRCQYQASLYAIEKLPAIVIDHTYVTYGIDSVSEALSLMEKRGEAHA